jgi:hypothetical protein
MVRASPRAVGRRSSRAHDVVSAMSRSAPGASTPGASPLTVMEASSSPSGDPEQLRHGAQWSSPCWVPVRESVARGSPPLHTPVRAPQLSRSAGAQEAEDRHRAVSSERFALSPNSPKSMKTDGSSPTTSAPAHPGRHVVVPATWHTRLRADLAKIGVWMRGDALGPPIASADRATGARTGQRCRSASRRGWLPGSPGRVLRRPGGWTRGFHGRDERPSGATVSDMLTTSQLTTAQRRIRESMPKESSDIGRVAHHRIQLARVRESVARIPDRTRRP